MKLLITAITFAATLGILFLIETGKSPKEDYAQIIEALMDENTNTIVSATPSPTKVHTFVTTPTPLPTGPSPSPTPSTTLASTLPPSTTPKPTPEQSEKININTAGLEELDNITGVGLVIGQRIIDYRSANGLFQKIEDIKEVRGIGDITFEKMKNEITVGDQ